MATPFWDVDAAVKEIHRCAALGHRAVLFSGAPHEFGFPYIGDRHWDPFWKAVQDVNLPVSLHIGSGDFSKEFAVERIAAHGIGSTIASQTVGILLKSAIQLSDLLLCGVLPRNPDLKVVVVESGVGWIPFVLEAADHTFEYAQITRDQPEFKERPSEYFRRQVYGCYFFEEFAPRRLFGDGIPVDNVMFETDYPHPVCLYGNVREKIDAGLAEQPREVQRKVLFDTAASLYQVESPDRPWR